MALRRAKKIVLEVDQPTRVLVVHDDVDGCELLVRVLSGAGYVVSRAHDFDEMSDLLSDERAPNCLVLDVTSGGIGGNLKLLDAVRQHRNPDIAGARVVLVSSSTSNALFSWQAGIDEFLVRPMHANDLIGAIASAVDRPETDRRQHRRRMVDAAKAGAGTPD